jgi:ABC-type nickel/cobalt efflux system permease component RcnA
MRVGGGDATGAHPCRKRKGRTELATPLVQLTHTHTHIYTHTCALAHTTPSYQCSAQTLMTHLSAIWFTFPLGPGANL